QAAADQRQYWHLVQQPIPGFRHDFFIREAFHTGEDLKLHYVVSTDRQPSPPSSPNIAIFIHGFPDSYTLWTQIIASERLKDYTCIAVDLPGYGGSDDLPEYNAQNVLDTMAFFILEMRKRYLKAGGRVVLVTHDWGAVIGARLASEAPELAERWILMSGLIVTIDDWNAAYWQVLAFLRQPFQLKLRYPLKLHHLSVAWGITAPLRSQLSSSFYVFVLTLPRPLAGWFATFGNFWFLRLLHLTKTGRLKPDGKLSTPFTPKQSADHIAQSAGPGLWELQATLTPLSRGGRGYEADAALRIPHLGMREKIKIYRDGLLWGDWDKSFHLRFKLGQPCEPWPAPSSSTASASASAPHFQPPTPPTSEPESDDKIGHEALRGRIKSPATIIMGGEDPAFELKMVLTGVEDYLPPRSQVVVFEKGGHWLPAEKVSAEMIEHVVLWALAGEEVEFRECLAGFEDWEMLVDKKDRGKLSFLQSRS
ncbi:alpha/beta-hydrolase, partial [Lophiostoma macrostomum CBS 122681]